MVTVGLKRSRMVLGHLERMIMSIADACAGSSITENGRCCDVCLVLDDDATLKTCRYVTRQNRWICSACSCDEIRFTRALTIWAMDRAPK
jgi:hypothetical protein